MSSPTSKLAIAPGAGRPMLIMLSGLPGSGKSYFGRLLANDLPASIVENDSIRRKLFSDRVYSDSENRQVYRAAVQRIRDLLERGSDVIFDATNLTEAARRAVHRLAAEMNAGLAIVQFVVPEYVAVERLDRRMSAPDSLDNSEAGRDVYALLQPIFSRSRLPHWRVARPEQAPEVAAQVVAAIADARNHRGDQSPN